MEKPTIKNRNNDGRNALLIRIAFIACVVILWEVLARNNTKMAFYTSYPSQILLDLIEFANGPPDSRWGSIRADMGHPEPFHMKMIGIGNEQWGPQYIERYKVFAKAIKAKHPAIQLIDATGSDAVRACRFAPRPTVPDGRRPRGPASAMH